MPLNIKNDEVEELATEVARLARETKTEAIRKALLERKHRLTIQGVGYSRSKRLANLLTNRIWPQVGKQRKVTKKERENILGYGEYGV